MDTIGCNPHWGIRGDKKIPDRMQQILKAEDAMAGTKNDPQAFNIPMATDASEIHRRNGDMIRVI
jgi:hypothetical protein